MKNIIKYLSGLVIIVFVASFLNVVMVEAAGLSSAFNSPEQKKEYTAEEKKQAIKDAISDDNISGEEEEKLLDMYGGDTSALIKDMLPELILNYTSDGNLDDNEIGRLESLVELAKGDNEMLADALVTAFPSLNKDDIVTTFKNKPDKVKENVRELARAATNKKIEDKPKSATGDGRDADGFFPESSSVIKSCSSSCDPNCTCGLKGCPSLTKSDTNSTDSTGNTGSRCPFGGDNSGGGDNTTSQGTKDAFKPQNGNGSNTNNPFGQQEQVKSDDEGTVLYISATNSDSEVEKALYNALGLTELQIMDAGMSDEFSTLKNKLIDYYGIKNCTGTSKVKVTIDFTKHPEVKQIKDYVASNPTAGKDENKAKQDSDAGQLSNIQKLTVNEQDYNTVSVSGFTVESISDKGRVKELIRSEIDAAQAADIIAKNQTQGKNVFVKLAYKAIMEKYDGPDKDKVLSLMKKLKNNNNWVNYGYLNSLFKEYKK